MTNKPDTLPEGRGGAGACVERLAAKLSKAQRRWLLSVEPTLEKVSHTPCEEWWDNPDQLYVEIDGIDHWLGSRGMESPAGCPKFTDGWERLTPLGLALRQSLLNQEKPK